METLYEKAKALGVTDETAREMVKDYYRNRKPVPEYVRRAFEAASGPLGSGRLYINNARANDYLGKHLGINSENVHTINGETVNFDWRTRRWYICCKH